MRIRSYIIDVIDNGRGETQVISPVGIKNFASSIDIPDRIKVYQEEQGTKVYLENSSMDREQHISVSTPMADFCVGAASGVVIGAQSSTTLNLVTSIDTDAKNAIIGKLPSQNSRALINVDASLRLIKNACKIL